MSIANTAHGGSASSATAATSKAVTVTAVTGETIIVAVCTAISEVPTTPTDNATGSSNTYVLLGTHSGTTYRVTLFGCLSSKSAVTSVTCAFGSSRYGIAISTYTGVEGFNQANTQVSSGSSTPATITLPTALGSGSWILAGFSNHGTGTWSANGSYNLREHIAGAGSTTPGAAIVDYTTTTCAATLSASSGWSGSAIELSPVALIAAGITGVGTVTASIQGLLPDGWAQVNYAKGSGTSNPTNTAAFANALTAGSLIIVSVMRQSNAPSTPTDTAGNTYFDCGAGAATGTFVGVAGNLQLFYALNTHTTASNVIHTADASGDYVSISAAEFTGNAASAVVRAFQKTSAGTSGTGGGQNVTTPSIAAQNTDLIIGTAYCNAGTLTLGTNFFSAGAVVDAQGMLEFLIASGAAAATWNDGTNSDSYGAVGAAFIAVSSGNLAAVIAGQGTVTAAVTGTGALASVISGQATVTAAVTGAGALASVINGVGTVTAAIQGFFLISATINGVGTVVGNITGSGALADVINGTSTVTGAVTGTGALASVINGSATVTASLSELIAATINGSGTVTATATGKGSLAGIIAGNGTVVGALTGVGALASVISGTGTVTASLKGTGAIAGVINGSGTVSSTLTGVGALAAAINGIATIVAALSGPSGSIAANINGVGAVTIALTGVGALAGVINGLGSVSGTLKGTGAAAGVIGGQSSVVGALFGLGAVASTVLGSGTVNATGSAFGFIVSNIEGIGSVICAISGTVSGAISANIFGNSVASAVLLNFVIGRALTAIEILNKVIQSLTPTAVTIYSLPPLQQEMALITQASINLAQGAMYPIGVTTMLLALCQAAIVVGKKTQLITPPGNTLQTLIAAKEQVFIAYRRIQQQDFYGLSDNQSF